VVRAAGANHFHSDCPTHALRKCTNSIHCARRLRARFRASGWGFLGSPGFQGGALGISKSAEVDGWSFHWSITGLGMGLVYLSDLSSR